MYKRQKSIQAEVDNSKVKCQLRKKTRMMDDNSKSKEEVVIVDVESMTKQQHAPNKTQTKFCPSMSIDQFLKENGNNEDEGENVQNGSEDEEQYVGEENAYQDEDGEVNMIEGKCFIITTTFFHIYVFFLIFHFMSSMLK